MTEFIFVRHGQSEANAAGIIANSDSKLTKEGLAQARKTAGRLKQLNITRIVCSPMLRAQQTAEIIAGELGMSIKDIKVIKELGERGLGECEGKPKVHPSEWYSQSNDPTLEPRQLLLDRMHTALDKINQAEEIGPVVVVGHGVSGFYLVEAAKGAKTLSDIGPDGQILNADFVKVKLDD